MASKSNVSNIIEALTVQGRAFTVTIIGHKIQIAVTGHAATSTEDPANDDPIGRWIEENDKPDH